MPVVYRPIPGRNSAPGSGGNRPPGQGGNRAPGRVPPTGIPIWTPARTVLPAPPPDPLPIAPLLDWKWAAGLAVGALLSEWGQLNAPRLEVPISLPYTYNRPGIYQIQFSRLTAISGKLCADGSSFSDSWSSVGAYGIGTSTRPASSATVASQTLNTQLRCQQGVGPLQYGLTISGQVTNPAQSVEAKYEEVPEWTYSAIDGLETREIAITAVLRNGVPQELPPTTQPVPRPKVPILPSVLPRQQPWPQPGPARPEQVPAPVPEIEPDQSPVPVEPGPNLVPAFPLPLPPSVIPGRNDLWPVIRDGRVVESAPAPVPTTRPDAIYPIPGAPPVIGNGPQTTPTGISQELGRIEQKLHMLMNPIDAVPDWIQLLRDLYELLTSLTGGTTYTLQEFCNPDSDPNYQPQSWEFEAPGALTFSGVLANRLDALALMIDQSLRAKQQICPPSRRPAQGQPVTVNFIANTKPEGSSAYLRKTMRYRDQTGTPEADHVDHWAGFEWSAGPAIVTSQGAPWGVVQVWAETDAEGRRVIEHAAAIAGVDLTAEGCRWEYSSPRSSRYGKTGTMRVEHDMTGTPCISKRAGSDGRPDWALNP